VHCIFSVVDVIMSGFFMHKNCNICFLTNFCHGRAHHGALHWAGWVTVCKMVPLSLWTIVLYVCPVCDIGVLWPNGWTDQDETWHAGRPRPRPHCVRWGSSSPMERGTAALHRRPPHLKFTGAGFSCVCIIQSMFIVAKRLHGSSSCVNL